MLSTCPTCLSQVDHPDAALKVTCECGYTFSPFLADSDVAGAEAPQEDSFKESSALFQEIREFGESLGFNAPASTTKQNPQEHLNKMAEEFKPEVETTSPEPAISAAGALVTITTADTLAGQVIEKYFPPISVTSQFQPDLPDPLSAGIQVLSERAQAAGANAVIGLRFNCISNQQTVLLGIPVSTRSA